MAYNHEYPYVDSGMSNADWILHKIKEMIAEWATMQDGWKELQEEFKQLNINFTDLENQFKQLIIENNEFKTSITDIVNQFKADITQQFNEYKTEINEALSTFEQHITEEFTDLSNYVHTTINNLPTEVKNIFQTYIDDGTIEEMLKGIIPPDVSAQVEKNTNDIAAIKTEQTTQNNNISSLQTTVGGHTTQITGLQTTVGQHTTQIGALQTTVGQHTTQISQLQTEQSEIMNDIADINELDVTQNNRLTALENRPAGGKRIWFITQLNMTNFIVLLNNLEQQEPTYFHSSNYSSSIGTIPELINNNSISPGNVIPTDIVISSGTGNNSLSFNEYHTAVLNIVTAIINKYTFDVHIWFCQALTSTVLNGSTLLANEIKEKTLSLRRTRVSYITSIWPLTWGLNTYSNNDFAYSRNANQAASLLLQIVTSGYNPWPVYTEMVDLDVAVPVYVAEMSKARAELHVYFDHVEYDVDIVIANASNTLVEVTASSYKTICTLTGSSNSIFRSTLGEPVLVSSYTTGGQPVVHSCRMLVSVADTSHDVTIGLTLGDSTTTALFQDINCHAHIVRYFI